MFVFAATWDLFYYPPTYALYYPGLKYLGASFTYGDFDGDGKIDLVVGAPATDSNTGAVLVLFDEAFDYIKENFSPGSYIDISSMPYKFLVTGIDSGDWCGSSVAAGDVDGNGKDDLLIGVGGGDGPSDSRSGCGEAYLIFDSAITPGVTYDLSAKTDYFVVYGANSGDGLTSCGGRLQDVNNDGKCEIGLYASGVDQGGNTDCGAVYIIDGTSATSGGTYDLASAGSDIFTVYGNTSNSELYLSEMYDMDGDGKGDLLMGYYDGNIFKKCVCVYYGFDISLNGSSYTVSTGGSSQFTARGVSLPNTCEVNGDGNVDMAVRGGFAGNKIYILNGTQISKGSDYDFSTGSSHFCITGTPGLNFCAPSCGDVDSNGKDDVLLGWSDYNAGEYRTGEGYCISDSLIKLDGSSYDLNSSDSHLRFIGWRYNDGFGRSPGVPLDLFGDGVAEVVFGSTYFDGFLNESGDCGGVFIFDLANPVPPELKSCSSDDLAVSLVWRNLFPFAQSFKIRYGTSEDNLNLSLSTSENSATVTVPTEGDWFFSVSCVYSGHEGASPTVKACCILAPTDLKAYTKPEGVYLTWKDNSAIEKGYVIYRASDDKNFVKVAEVSSNTTSYLDKAPPGVWYYKVRAFTDSGYSSYSEEVEAVSRGNVDEIISLLPNVVKRGEKVVIVAESDTMVKVFNVAGIQVDTFSVKQGEVVNYTVNLSPSIYYFVAKGKDGKRGVKVLFVR